MDFLDPSVIPALPGPGGMISHAELMGRPKIVFQPATTQTHPAVILPYRTSSQPSPRLAVGSPSDLSSHLQPKHASGSGATLSLPKPGAAVKRAASLDDRSREGTRRRSKSAANTSMVARTGAATPSDQQSASDHHGDVSASNHQHDHRSQTVPPPDCGRKLKRSERVKSMVGGRRGRHGRTMSDVTSTFAPPHQIHPDRHSSLPRHHHSRHSSIAALGTGEAIRLGTERDEQSVTRILLSLRSLTPPSRALPDHLLPIQPPPFLHPSTLLVPLAIVLEALVVERSVLRNEHQHTAEVPRLPTLTDGSPLQITPEQGGSGELDWAILRRYVVTLGVVISDILPYLQEAEQGQVEGLTKSLRVYVGKMKKVFGEIAGMYVEGYGFLKGWWDDEGMKGAAAEVGRWGDLFDA